MKWLLLSLSILSLQTWAVPEKKLQDLIKSEIIPHFEKTEFNEFAGEKDVLLQYKIFRGPRSKSAANKTLVVFNGRTEPMIKYAELIYDLRNEPFDIFIMDHRGQGFSERMVKDDSHMGYIENFNYYVQDAKKFVEEIVKKNSTGAIHVMGHSMGGAIAALYMEKYPREFASAVLSSPMIDFYTKGIPRGITTGMTGLLALLGQGKSYAPGEKKFNQYADFDTNNLTTSIHRFANNNNLEVEYPTTVIRGPSVRWVNQSLKACKQSLKNAYKVETPVLLLQAGSDTIVKNRAQDKFCSQVTNCRKVVYPAARHEILQEQDEIRNQALGKIKKFILGKET